MNQNALQSKSTIKFKKTSTGKSNAGFSKTDGVIMSNAKYYTELKKNGYKVEFTPYGVLISK